MKYLLTAVLLIAAAPVLAEPVCSPGATLAPVWQAIKTFEDLGGIVATFKINDGQCYEIYGTLDGVKMEVFFDPNTAQELGRAEQ